MGTGMWLPTQTGCPDMGGSCLQSYVTVFCFGCCGQGTLEAAALPVTSAVIIMFFSSLLPPVWSITIIAFLTFIIPLQVTHLAA